MVILPALRQFHLYHSLRCPGCSAPIGNKEEDFLPQIIPVSPEIFVSYFCKTCFLNIPTKEIIKQVRTYLSSEDRAFREYVRKQRQGRFIYDPFQFLEDSIKFLRGMTPSPPFICAIFLLHEQQAKESASIRYRAHLTLVSFD